MTFWQVNEMLPCHTMVNFDFLDPMIDTFDKFTEIFVGKKQMQNGELANSCVSFPEFSLEFR